MRNLKILGHGAFLPEHTMRVKDGTRYRATNETQLDMAVGAIEKALANANLEASELDCIVSASAVGVQPIPCTAALIHERIACGNDIPAMDINTTCTSFITALDVMSYLIDAGRYRNVLIVASELASPGLNPKQEESFELFSDGACAFIFGRTDDKNQGVIASRQCTWSEGAHATEICGGLTGLNATHYSPETHERYFFDMDGFSVLKLCAKKLPQMFRDFCQRYDVNLDDIKMVIPHQASRALPMIMKRLKIPDEKYVNIVGQYGNQVSVSVPFALDLMLDMQKLQKGDKIILCGTAAGLTSNILLMEL